MTKAQETLQKVAKFATEEVFVPKAKEWLGLETKPTLTKCKCKRNVIFAYYIEGEKDRRCTKCHKYIGKL